MGDRRQLGPRAGTRAYNSETGGQTARWPLGRVVDPPEGTVWDIHVWQPMRKSLNSLWACDVCGTTRRELGPRERFRYAAAGSMPSMPSLSIEERAILDLPFGPGGPVVGSPGVIGIPAPGGTTLAGALASRLKRRLR